MPYGGPRGGGLFLMSEIPLQLEIGRRKRMRQLCYGGLVANEATRWSTTRASKVDLHPEINFGALCGANLVT